MSLDPITYEGNEKKIDYHFDKVSMHRLFLFCSCSGLLLLSNIRSTFSPFESRKFCFVLGSTLFITRMRTGNWNPFEQWRVRIIEINYRGNLTKGLKILFDLSRFRIIESLLYYKYENILSICSFRKTVTFDYFTNNWRAKENSIIFKCPLNLTLETTFFQNFWE